MMEKLKPFVAMLVRRLLGYGAVALATHGVVLSPDTNSMVIEVAIAAAMSALDVGWSVYDKYIREIVLAKLEIFKATTLAQAAALRGAMVPPPTAADIADRVPDPKVTADVVAKVMTETRA